MKTKETKKNKQKKDVQIAIVGSKVVTLYDENNEVIGAKTIYQYE